MGNLVLGWAGINVEAAEIRTLAVDSASPQPEALFDRALSEGTGHCGLVNLGAARGAVVIPVAVN